LLTRGFHARIVRVEPRGLAANPRTLPPPGGRGRGDRGVVLKADNHGGRKLPLSLAYYASSLRHQALERRPAGAEQSLCLSITRSTGFRRLVPRLEPKLFCRDEGVALLAQHYPSCFRQAKQPSTLRLPLLVALSVRRKEAPPPRPWMPLVSANYARYHKRCY